MSTTEQQQLNQPGSQPTKSTEEEKKLESLSPVPGKVSSSPIISGGGTTTGTEQQQQQAAVSGEQQQLLQQAIFGGAAGYPTSEALFVSLCKAKADTFAIGPQPPSQSPIWVCNREDKIIDVFSGLIKRNISSVPVLLKSNKYFGFLDLADIVRYVVQHFGSVKLSGPGTENKNFMDLLGEERIFATQTVDDLMQFPYQPSHAQRNAFHPVQAGYSAFAVVEVLARERGIRRVPVVDAERRVLNLVTNSQVLKYLSSNVDALGGISHKPVSECRSVIKPVLSVTEESLAIEAFNLMVEQDVVGVAIVNGEGRLRGNLSLRDLKLIGSDAALFWRLHQSVKNFVLKLRHEYQQRHGRPRTVVYMLPTATLRDVIQTMCEHSLHRIYICDSHHTKTPVGVVSIQDILFEIINN